MRVIFTKCLILISFLGTTHLNTILAQEASSLTAELRKAIFPENRGEQRRTSYYGCVTSDDSLILYIRKVQPDIEATISLLQKIALNQNKQDTVELSEIYALQTRIFKQEWACGLRQFPLCEDVRSQLKLLRALETTLTSFRLDKLYPTPQQKFEYWKQVSDAFFIKLYKQNPGFEEYLDEATNNYIRSLSEEDLKLMRDKLIWIQPYYRQIQEEKNAFGGVFLEWSFVTPFLEEIKESYQTAYQLFQRKTRGDGLDYNLEKSFFEHFTKKADFEKLNSNY